jgi:hypothetical protein
MSPMRTRRPLTASAPRFAARYCAPDVVEDHVDASSLRQLRTARAEVLAPVVDRPPERRARPQRRPFSSLPTVTKAACPPIAEQLDWRPYRRRRRPRAPGRPSPLANPPRAGEEKVRKCREEPSGNAPGLLVAHARPGTRMTEPRSRPPPLGVARRPRGCAMTRSPAARPRTAAPISSTSPAHSRPEDRRRPGRRAGRDPAAAGGRHDWTAWARTRIAGYVWWRPMAGEGASPGNEHALVSGPRVSGWRACGPIIIWRAASQRSVIPRRARPRASCVGRIRRGIWRFGFDTRGSARWYREATTKPDPRTGLGNAWRPGRLVTKGGEMQKVSRGCSSVPARRAVRGARARGGPTHSGQVIIVKAEHAREGDQAKVNVHSSRRAGTPDRGRRLAPDQGPGRTR